VGPGHLIDARGLLAVRAAERHRRSGMTHRPSVRRADRAAAMRDGAMIACGLSVHHRGSDPLRRPVASTSMIARSPGSDAQASAPMPSEDQVSQAETAVDLLVYAPWLFNHRNVPRYYRPHRMWVW
jgi:hypothetical protein